MMVGHNTNTRGNKMAEHTRGEWAWRQFGKDWTLCTNHSGALIVLDAVRKGMQGAAFRVRNNADCLMMEFDPEHPDARLIAAAPTLFEALKALANAHTYGGELDTVEYGKVWDQVDAALKLVTPSPSESKPEPIVSVTFQQLSDSNYWLDFCRAYAMNEYYMNEGGDPNETVKITVQEYSKWFD